MNKQAAGIVDLSQKRAFAHIKNERGQQALLKLMADDRTWDVWMLGEKTEDNPEGRYFLGKIPAATVNPAVAARNRWPEHGGRMIVERSP